MSVVFHYLWFGIAVCVAWGLLIFLFAVHEYGHLLACYRRRVPVGHVELGQLRFCSVKFRGLRHDFGLLPFMAAVHCDYRGVTLETKAFVAACGPAASLLLGVGLLLLERVVGPNFLMNITGWASLVLVAINMVPLPPMDGFAVLEYGLSKRGIFISERRRRYLFAAGVTFIVLTILFV